MATMLCKTKGNVNPKGKPRVYFTCHPADFEKYFDKICEDIFKTHDCAIYYTEDMSAPIPVEDLDTDLGSNNLFVIPVTFKLLTQPNRAMDEDFPYAQKEHIPVLPIMMEPGIDAFYSAPNKFGKLQYLNPYSTDLTEISYEEKLKKYLESVLISDETAKRVRAAFDAYIFLSYRKKDRRYANELMRLIHRNPACRDIAIWYDEFLTPGESFQDSIEKILHSSKLFTLLVTPNLLEESDGKPNFVMAQEYPAAKEAGIDILPAEMESTDKAALSEKFHDIPECVDPTQENTFHDALLTAIQKAAITTNDTNPEHNFLIGLAYLDGIDVEVDRERGLVLITSAAESNLPEAMEKLYNMYDSGVGVMLSYQNAAHWAAKLVEYYKQTLGDEHIDTLLWMNDLAVTYSKLCEHQKALELLQKVYTLRCAILGDQHLETLIALGNLASVYGDLGNQQKALELKEKVYTLRCKLLGEEHPNTLDALNNLSFCYSSLGDHKKALALLKKVHPIRCNVMGEEHPGTLTSLSNLASVYGDLGDHKKALELQEKVYALRCKVSGEEHPDTLISLSNLATIYDELGDHKKALELEEKVYTLQFKVLGEKHPDTILTLNNLSYTYSNLGDYKKALELQETVYTLYRDILGDEHSSTLTALSNLAAAYGDTGDNQKDLTLTLQVYTLRCNVLGEEHPDTLISLYNLVSLYSYLGNYQKALELGEKAYALQRKLLGEEHPDTFSILNNLSALYSHLGDHQKALELKEKVYALQFKVLGEVHPDTLNTLNYVASIYRYLGNYQKALELMEQVYLQRLKVLGETHPDTITAQKTWQATQERLKSSTE